MVPSSVGQELDVVSGDGELVRLEPPYTEDGGELIKNGGGAEKPAGYPNYVLWEGAIERIECRHNGTPRRNIFLTRDPPGVFTATTHLFLGLEALGLGLSPEDNKVLANSNLCYSFQTRSNAMPSQSVSHDDTRKRLAWPTPGFPIIPPFKHSSRSTSARPPIQKFSISKMILDGAIFLVKPSGGKLRG
ncbi:hypothetical protein B9Z19DRAFT_1131742 [Tuber borchii]|uniref:Uncharacterized protein n=1 Tax=Tuber borchii TaxID=42251 RepID=A0A2T6ZIB0_TUBBO|nr:hypothetical protein B9Z19DRAFT_1131742 [Tuber borchii]